MKGVVKWGFKSILHKMHQYQPVDKAANKFNLQHIADKLKNIPNL